MRGGFWKRLTEVDIEIPKTLQASSLGGFFIRHTSKKKLTHRGRYYITNTYAETNDSIK
jgi:hypothetical protein